MRSSVRNPSKIHNPPDECVLSDVPEVAGYPHDRQYGRGEVMGYYTQGVETVLGDRVICDRCGAKLATYADACIAALDDACPGFVEIESAVRVATTEGKNHG